MVIIVIYLGLLLSIYTDVNTETTHGILPVHVFLPAALP